jgi:hypothetical protein
LCSSYKFTTRRTKSKEKLAILDSATVHYALEVSATRFTNQKSHILIMKCISVKCENEPSLTVARPDHRRFLSLGITGCLLMTTV